MRGAEKQGERCEQSQRDSSTTFLNLTFAYPSRPKTGSAPGQATPMLVSEFVHNLGLLSSVFGEQTVTTYRSCDFYDTQVSPLGWTNLLLWCTLDVTLRFARSPQSKE